MTTHATTPSATHPSDDARRPWTLARSLAESSSAARIVAAGAAMTIVAATAVAEVPWPVAIVLVALLPAVLVDVVVRRLPNRLVGGAALTGTCAVALSLAVGSDIDLVGLALGAAVMCTPLLVAHLLSPASMGFGDVKLALVVGAAMGIVDVTSAVLALAAGATIAGAYGLATRQRTIAFGPALLLGAVVVLVAHAIGALPTPDSTAAFAAGRTH